MVVDVEGESDAAAVYEKPQLRIAAGPSELEVSSLPGWPGSERYP